MPYDCDSPEHLVGGKDATPEWTKAWFLKRYGDDPRVVKAMEGDLPSRLTDHALDYLYQRSPAAEAS